jgi:hypothetical protein
MAKRKAEELVDVVLRDVRLLIEQHLGMVEKALHRAEGDAAAAIVLTLAFESEDKASPMVRVSAKVKLPSMETAAITLDWRGGGQLVLGFAEGSLKPPTPIGSAEYDGEGEGASA